MKKILTLKKNAVGMALKKIEGKYMIAGKKGEFSRPQFYDKLIREKMSD